ncbi:MULTISPECIES: dTDP-4-dehydrorhamnose reductase [unclassified Bacillus (in: firmicutes)]|uniref:dTDP-4-dehydrorhamnose reductase n=1 Tax=unclassified Bacillus (in: firmicutes) TaxID=185979 RepID=UPI00232E0285|nr:dTDP-4-dehydrorhamnose reductase [Bacillus sp. BP-3]MDC2863932.1 dTDP-4-dehydrorhamnose reductase [Bacillus sp. BP-3]
MKERIMITGANGQLGRQIVEDFGSELYEIYPFDKKSLNITDMSQVEHVMKTIKPHIIIHCAAYTKVDQAEEEQDLAYVTNAIGTRNVTVMAQSLGAKFIYISTDYVFSGSRIEGYHEWHIPEPVNVYGLSKYAGEEFVKSFHDQYFIIRTSWLYGKNGNNFVKTMLRISEEKELIAIVSDQIGSPTYVKDLVHVIKKIMNTSLYGIYHVSNSGSCSWYEFAKQIFSYANKKVNVVPISTEEFGAKALRPKYSILQNKMLKLNGFSQMPTWEEGLEGFFSETKNH